MDSHAFRIVGAELLELLNGARIEKIHAPVDDLLVFSLFSKGHKWKLALAFGRAFPALFIYTATLPNPPTPPNIVMRLRKYLSGHRLGEGTMDYAARQLLFPLPAVNGYSHLLLSFGKAPELLSSIPENFGKAPVWPGKDVVAPMVQAEGGQKASSNESVDKDLEQVGKAYPVLAPKLREALRFMDLPDAMALLVDLEIGGGDLFYYQSKKAVFYSAWPIPDELAAQKGFEEVDCDDLDNGYTLHVFGGYAVNFVRSSRLDEAAFLAGLGAGMQNTALKPLRQENKKTQRLLKTLEQEEKRLTSMMEMRSEACLLQNALWQFSPEEKRADVYIEDGSGLRHIILDPRLTVRGNMQRMFHQSDRGARGLAFLRERKAKITLEAEAQSEALLAGTPGSIGEIPKRLNQGKSTGKRNILDKTAEIKEVQIFRSVDNYTILRGKSAKGNQKLLKLGQSYDLWLHSKDGPSAHAIIRLPHPADNVPESTMLEAARLVGEKSWQRDDAKAEIMVAMLCHVHSIKGGAPGAVRVDKVQRTLLVNLVENDR